MIQTKKKFHQSCISTHASDLTWLIFASNLSLSTFLLLQLLKVELESPILIAIQNVKVGYNKEVVETYQSV